MDEPKPSGKIPRHQERALLKQIENLRGSVMKTEDCETWVANHTITGQELARAAFQAGERHGIEKAIASAKPELLTKELVRRLPPGPSYDKFALSEIEAHLCQNDEHKEKQLPELGNWVHSADEISVTELVEIGAALLEPYCSSIDHRNTLAVCRRLFDEVIRLRGIEIQPGLLKNWSSQKQ